MDDAARLAMRLEEALRDKRLWLSELPLEELPPALAEMTELQSLELSELPRLRSARGIERLVALQRLSLWRLSPETIELVLARACELPQLDALSLGPATWHALPPSFDRLQGLLSIEISGAGQHDLSSLFERLAGLSGLRVLTLRGDRPVTLPPSVALLRNLRELNLAASCSTLPAELTTLVELETLTVAPSSGRRDLLKQLPSTIGGMRGLRHLILRGHRIGAVPASLTSLVELRELDLFGCRIPSLPEDLGALTNLETLDLSYCEKLTRLPESIGSLSNLRALHAAGAGFTELPESFSALRLRTCSLPGQLLAQVELAPPDTLFVDDLAIERAYDRSLPADLGDPRKLTLQVPRLEGQAPALSALRRIESLTIGRAPAFDLADAFVRLSGAEHLTRLSISSAGLRAVPPEIGRLRRLERLNLSNNELESLPPDLAALPALRELNLSRTRVAALPPGFPALEVLEARNLPALPTGIGHAAHLRELDLAFLKAHALDSDLARCTALEKLTLHGADVRDLGVLAALPRLKALNLCWARVPDDLDALFTALGETAIEELDFSDATGLNRLPSSIGRLSKLSKLDLGCSELTTVPEELKQLGALAVVYFKDSWLPTATLKKNLPPGRWRKSGSGNRAVYVRG